MIEPYTTAFTSKTAQAVDVDTLMHYNVWLCDMLDNDWELTGDERLPLKKGKQTLTPNMIHVWFTTGAPPPPPPF